MSQTMNKPDPIWDFYDKWLEERFKRFEAEVNQRFDYFEAGVNLDHQSIIMQSIYLRRKHGSTN